MTEYEARKFINDFKTARKENSDAIASKSVFIYPTLKNGVELIKSGTRINWNGQIKKAAVDLWDNELSTPETAPNLWENIEYKEGYRIIPEIITVTNAFALDEIGWWWDETYRSLLEANVYTPVQYPQGWEKYERS